MHALIVCLRRTMENRRDHGSSLDSSRSKKLKPCEEKDRISTLPDSLIHHIFTFLPSTKDVVKTSIFSEKWHHQWTRAPNLIFCSTHITKSIQNFSRIIDKNITLHACSSKIDKFVIRAHYKNLRELHSKLDKWICFAKRKEAKEIILDFSYSDYSSGYFLPLFFCNNASLITLKVISCGFMSICEVNWRALKVLYISLAKLSNEVTENISSGCPVLESLELHHCYGFDNLDIASKCLKSLVLDDIFDPEGKFGVLKISAPSLEFFKLLGRFRFKGCKLVTLPNLISAELDFVQIADGVNIDNDHDMHVDFINFAKEILQQVQYAQELSIGAWCIQILSVLELKGLPSPLSDSKCLILNVPGFVKDLPLISSLLGSLPVVQKLTVKLRAGTCLQYGFYSDFEDVNRLYVENNWASCKGVSNSLSHLKHVEILGLNASFRGCDRILGFVELLLKNATVLEKMVIFYDPSRGSGSRTEFVFDVSQKLLSMPRSSPHASVIAI